MAIEMEKDTFRFCRSSTGSTEFFHIFNCGVQRYFVSGLFLKNWENLRKNSQDKLQVFKNARNMKISRKSNYSWLPSLILDL